MKLLSKKEVGQRRVYDIEVEDVHNFYANGVNVHNCATDGGVSVIKDDGTVVDVTFTGYSNQSATVTFDEKSRVVAKWFKYSVCFEIPDSDFSTAQPRNIPNKEYAVGEDGYEPAYDVLPVLENNVTIDHAFAGPNGLSLLSKDNGMVNYITSSYQSGYQPGDIKLAALSDTDDTDLVGSGELVTNGTFDTDTSGWTAGPDTTISVVSNRLRVTNLGTAYGYAYQAFPTVVGATYTVTVDITFNSGFARLNIANSHSQTSFANIDVNASGRYTHTFVATATTTYVNVGNRNDADIYNDFDNISVKLADEDRSVNNNGLVISGNITREPVATGADLVSYSGFSASNYLEQPYNSDLDFGTGDFCVMGWVKGTAATDTFVSRAAHSGSFSGAAFILDANGSAQPRFRITDDGFSTEDKVEDTSALTDDWTFLCGIVQSSVVYLYRDGELIGSTSVSNAATGVSNASATLRLGLRQDGVPSNYSQALWRISATAPTAEQIAKIYNDEKVLFQENAQATLYGTSDAVTALAHDPVTDLLHVGTSDGRSVFQGLRRVDNTTDVVSTAISASNNLIVEQ